MKKKLKNEIFRKKVSRSTENHQNEYDQNESRSFLKKSSSLFKRKVLFQKSNKIHKKNLFALKEKSTTISTRIRQSIHLHYAY